MGCNCGGRTGASVDYQAKATNGKTETFGTNAEARIFLARNGGGSVRAVPKKAA